jgi:hypothetical protein
MPDSYTKLLLHCDEGTMSDSDNYETLLSGFSSAGNPVVRATVDGPFPGTANRQTFYFDGDARLIFPYNSCWVPGTGDFTWEFFARMAALPRNNGFMGQTVSSPSRGTNIFLDTSTGLTFVGYTGGGGNIAISQGNFSGWTSDTWYHIAVVKQGTTIRLFRNGIQIGSGSISQVVDVEYSAPFYVGSIGGSWYLSGYMAEIRVSKGIARYVSNFTPMENPYGDGTSGFQQQDFETFLGYALGTDIQSQPWQWLVSNSTATAMTVTSGLTSAKFIKRFQYLENAAKEILNKILFYK